MYQTCNQINFHVIFNCCPPSEGMGDFNAVASTHAYCFSVTESQQSSQASPFVFDLVGVLISEGRLCVITQRNMKQAFYVFKSKVFVSTALFALRCISDRQRPP